MSPVEAALAEIGKLAAAGAPQDQVVQLVGETVASWAGEEDMSPEAARNRIEQVWDSLGKDAADLEEAISDGANAAGAERPLGVLRAAIAALAAAHDRLG